MDEGIRPAKMRLAKSAKTSHKEWPGWSWSNISLRCCGLRPSLPPDAPEGKPLTVALMVSASMTSGGLKQAGGPRRSGGAGGCLAFMASVVAADAGAMESNDDRHLTAPEISPSCNLKEARLAANSSSVQRFFLPSDCV